MKKTLAMLMACAMTAASLAGCAPADKTQTTAATETAAPETSAAEPLLKRPPLRQLQKQLPQKALLTRPFFTSAL